MGSYNISQTVQSKQSLKERGQIIFYCELRPQLFQSFQTDDDTESIFIKISILFVIHFINPYFSGATAVDAISSGYRTILLDDCSRGVDLLDIEKTKNSVIKNHGVVVNSDKVKNMVEGNDRRLELGYKLALNIRENQQKSGVSGQT